MIEIKDLFYKKGKKEILKNININISKNKITGIIGPNGSGKTTLLKHLVREIESKNTIFIDNIAIEKISRKNFARKVAFVSQAAYIVKEILLEDLVKMGRYPYKKLFSNYSKKDMEVVEKGINAFSLEKLRKKNIGTLSGGELKRAFLARAFVQQTEIIFLDEPTNHLDIKYQLELMGFLKKMDNKTRICSLHDIDLALRFCDEIILMKTGEIVAYGPTKNVLTAENIEKVFGVKNEIKKIDDRDVIVYYD